MNVIDSLVEVLRSGKGSLAEIDSLYRRVKSKASISQETPSISFLHCALSNSSNSTEVLQLLLNRGANVNAVDDSSGTPLHFASENAKCSVNAVKCLLDNGANVNSVHVIHGSPLHGVLRSNRINFLKFKLLLDCGADVNVVDENQRTPLHFALYNPTFKKEVIAALLDKGADVNKQDVWKFSALHFAMRNTCMDHNVVNMLLEKGADVRLLNFKHQTSLGFKKTNFYTFSMLNKCRIWEVNRQYSGSGLRNLKCYYSVVKYTLLVDVPLAIKEVKNHPCSDHLLEIVASCKQEICEMDEEVAGSNVSLGDFLRPDPPSAVETREKNYCANCILRALSQNKYTWYRDVIFSKLKRKGLLENKLEELNVCTKKTNNYFPKESKNIIALDVFSVYSVAAYISDDDMLNFILAFFPLDKFNCHTVDKEMPGVSDENCISLKRSLGIGTESGKRPKNNFITCNFKNLSAVD